MTLAEAMVATLKSYGVKFLFGVPGGGSSLDLIAAADAVGIKFILCRGETSAALMAAVVGELTGAPGVVLTAIGPGAASAVNGVAYAHLERAPLILISDAQLAAAAVPPHQVFDLKALFSPIAKACHRLTRETGAAQFADLVSLVLSKPQGPVFIELSAGDAGQTVTAPLAVEANRRVVEAGYDRDLGRQAGALLGQSRRPLLLIGLQAARPDFGAPLLDLAERLGCPVLTTYKAKGVMADGHPQMLGHFTGAAGETEAFQSADLILWAGIDPVELISVAWRHDVPLLVLSDVSGLEFPVTPAVELIGPLAETLEILAAASTPSDWTSGEIFTLRSALRSRARLAGGDGHNAEDVVDAVVAAAGSDIAFTVDAGAHMISAMARIEAGEAQRVLKSTGLSTMGFALPAAIATSLVAPRRRVVAFTGDGGLMMCLAELTTAARLGCRLTVVVLNDAALSLIDVKQQRRQMQSIGVRYPAINFAAAAAGMGCRAWQVGRHDALRPALDEALAYGGTGLIDVALNPAGYGDQLASLRG